MTSKSVADDLRGETRNVEFKPTADISPITEHISIGGLSAYGNREGLASFGLLLNVAWELADYKEEHFCNVDTPPTASKTGWGQLIHHARLDDNEDNVEEQAKEILRAVQMVDEARLRGERVLVTCAAGRNRSGIVIAEHLIRAGGDPAAVVATIQRARSKALTNNAFVAWLMRKR